MVRNSVFFGPNRFFLQRWFSRDNDFEAGVIDVSAGFSLFGEHLFDDLLIVRHQRLEQACRLVAHLVRVLDDHCVNESLAICVTAIGSASKVTTVNSDRFPIPCDVDNRRRIVGINPDDAFPCGVIADCVTNVLAGTAAVEVVPHVVFRCELVARTRREAADAVLGVLRALLTDETSRIHCHSAGGLCADTQFLAPLKVIRADERKAASANFSRFTSESTQMILVPFVCRVRNSPATAALSASTTLIATPATSP